MRAIEVQLNGFVQQLDVLRAGWLRFTLKNSVLRAIYSDRSARLGLTYLFLSGIYFLISLRCSDFLLVLGPVVLGYPHLVASYRFLQRRARVATMAPANLFQIFLVLTAVALAIRFFGVSRLPLLPYGTWEILISIGAIAFVGIRRKQLSAVGLAAVLLLGVVKIAWMDPLAFIGIALLLHNWVAFGHWIKSARDRSSLHLAIAATLVFAIVHVAVFSGLMDSWISIPTLGSFAPISFQARGWALAPWSQDPAVWDRAVVLYAFGLSIHYFVWLQAIPQCLDFKEAPNSWRKSFEQLRADCGPKMVGAIFAFGALSLAFWWYSAVSAGRIYFGVAMLHGWLELAFLFLALSLALTKRSIKS